jgi:hypothetical protein
MTRAGQEYHPAGTRADSLPEPVHSNPIPAITQQPRMVLQTSLRAGAVAPILQATRVLRDLVTRFGFVRAILVPSAGEMGSFARFSPLEAASLGSFARFCPSWAGSTASFAQFWPSKVGSMGSFARIWHPCDGLNGFVRAALRPLPGRPTAVLSGLPSFENSGTTKPSTHATLDSAFIGSGVPRGRGRLFFAFTDGPPPSPDDQLEMACHP